jgi:hypothetical protein
VGFGRNPYIVKAQAAEQKAVDATDDASRVRAYRDAAHEWERAADRERPGKQRDELQKNAANNRALADGVGADAEDTDDPGSPGGGTPDPSLN